MLFLRYLQSDDTGRATVSALAACVQRGVRVRLLVDRFMTFKKTQEAPGLPALLAQAQAAGIGLRQWHDPQRPYDSNHRKMIVIDGAAAGAGDSPVALVGGRNFADHYRGDAWRDVDLVLRGPSVASLAQVFEAVWAGAAPAAGGGDPPHPVQPWVDQVPARILTDPMMRFVLAAIGAARKSVAIELAYFVAHEPLCGAHPNNWGSDDNPMKAVGRRMRGMTRAINKHFAGVKNPQIGCMACHQGRLKPGR